MIEESVKKYKSICSKKNTDRGCSSKSEVRKHNRAMQALNDLAEEICGDPASAQAIFDQLLMERDSIVQLSAAVHCLKYGYYTERAVSLLEKMAVGENLHLAFSAEMSLRVWRGEVPGKVL